MVGALAPLLAPYDSSSQDYDAVLQGPSGAHLLGTDELGRDELSRLMEGARTSLIAVTIVLTAAVAIGMLIGAIAAARGGRADEVLSRVIDVGLSLPSLVVALATIGILGPGYRNMIIALTLAAWPNYARLTRGLIISLKKRPYIEAVQLMGASSVWILFRHLLPASIGPLLVYASAEAGLIALSVATLSFLGLGIQPPTPEWGQMLVTGLPLLESHPSLVLLPGLALTFVVVGFNLLGEAIALDKLPRMLSRRTLRRRRVRADAELVAAEARPIRTSTAVGPG